MRTSKRLITDYCVPDAVLYWRAERLRAAGLTDRLAQLVAGNGGYDLHALLVLIDRGCPAELAVRILAPLDKPDTPC